MDNKILKVTQDVHWIGVLDKHIRTFDIIMETKYGTTYNAFFINAAKKATVEVVKEQFFDAYEQKLRKICNPEELEYIFINHTEPDHSGGLRKLLMIAPQATVIASNSAITFLKNQIGVPFKYQIVKEGDIIDLGNKKMSIISAPNLHWPDSIYSYLSDDKVLFTCDSFGAHFCHEAMYNDQVGDYNDAFLYYFNVILRPFSKFFLRAIEKIKCLEIEAICTGHGPLITSDIWAIVNKTVTLCKNYLANYPVTNNVLVAFVSAYGYTKTIAEIIKEGLEEVHGINVDFCDIEKMDAVTLGDKIEKASAYMIGSPTINQNMLPQIYQLFALMTPLREKEKLATCFGSYGWSGEAENNIISNIANLKMKYFGESCFLKFRPQNDDIEKIKEFAKRFGRCM